MPSPEEYLKIGDLARIFATSQRTIRRWVEEEKIPRPVLVAGVKRWRAVEIQQLQEAALLDRARNSEGRSRPKQAKQGHDS